MNSDLAKLQPYPFEKLAKLKADIQPNRSLEHIALSIGEPKHPTPGFITEEVLSHLHGLSIYPLTRGSDRLRESIANWLCNRFQLSSINPATQILPCNGTREALFAFAQAMVERSTNPLVMMPNPFYQIYEGAALLAGAEPLFLACDASNGFLPDYDAVSDAQWQRCQLLYLCNPANPTGAVTDIATLQKLINLAEQHDFIIASDECYSEIYFDETKPPAGLLQAASLMGNSGFKHCMVFHSLSKRSNAPGLRSGFVAGDAELIEPFFRYRTYHGSAMANQTQAASIRAWSDESHVEENRALYRQKFAAMVDILKDTLDIQLPDAGFYLWPKTPISDTEFSRNLYEQQNVTVVPGSYLSREINNHNPGSQRIRLALVAPLDECIDAAQRIKTFTHSI